MVFFFQLETEEVIALGVGTSPKGRLFACLVAGRWLSVLPPEIKYIAPRMVSWKLIFSVLSETKVQELKMSHIELARRRMN